MARRLDRRCGMRAAVLSVVVAAVLVAGTTMVASPAHASTSYPLYTYVDGGGVRISTLWHSSITWYSHSVVIRGKITDSARRAGDTEVLFDTVTRSVKDGSRPFRFTIGAADLDLALCWRPHPPDEDSSYCTYYILTRRGAVYNGRTWPPN